MNHSHSSCLSLSGPWADAEDAVVAGVDRPPAVAVAGRDVKRVVPILKKSGGCIFSSDHSVPSSVSLEDFRRITDLAKELGRY